MAVGQSCSRRRDTTVICLLSVKLSSQRNPLIWVPHEVKIYPTWFCKIISLKNSSPPNHFSGEGACFLSEPFIIQVCYLSTQLPLDRKHSFLNLESCIENYIPEYLASCVTSSHLWSGIHTVDAQYVGAPYSVHTGDGLQHALGPESLVFIKKGSWKSAFGVR